MIEEKSCGKGTTHDPHFYSSIDSNVELYCPGFRITGASWASEPWDRPDHYGGQKNPFEPIKIIEHYDLNFNLGNAIKYILRAPYKGTALEDLKKAYTYIGFEMRRLERLLKEEE